MIQWSSFNLYGFERNGLTNPFHPDYPIHPWPPGKLWPEQNYTGNWVSNDNCEISHRQPNLKQNLTIALIGDSRTRQLYRSIELYLQNKSCCFYDRQSVKYLANNSIPGISRLVYYYSRWWNDLKTGTLVSRVKRELEKNDGNFVFIIGDLLLHKLLAILPKTQKRAKRRWRNFF